LIILTKIIIIKLLNSFINILGKKKTGKKIEVKEGRKDED